MKNLNVKNFTIKKYTLKKIVFGIAATSIVTVNTGCTNIEASIPKTASVAIENSNDNNIYGNHIYEGNSDVILYKGKEYKEAYDPSDEFVVNEYKGVSYENGISTNSLYFIRIDGNIYLATKLTDINEDNIISKYYAIDTGDFLGQTLDINWYARAIKDIKTIITPETEKSEFKVSVDDALKDNFYFNGEYGLGKNLCKENIINATSIFSDKIISKKSINILLNDPLLTTAYVEKYNYPSFYSYSKEDYTFVPFTWYKDFFQLNSIYSVAFTGETSWYLNNMYEFVINDGNNTKSIFGYRASLNQTDSGFNYIYNVESSSYLDLSQFKVLEMKKAIGSTTVGKIREKLSISSEEYYSVNDLNVISTMNLEGDDVFEKYYISMRQENVGSSIYEYKILGENERVALFGRYDGSKLYIRKNTSTKKTSEGSYDGMMISLKKCLEKNGLSNYIKETYNEEELSTLLVKLRNKDLDLGIPLSETDENYKKINIEDIVVIDTSRENENSLVLIPSEKRYYVLIPYEPLAESDNPSNEVYYKICDETGLCSISYDDKIVKIDNILKRFYAVAQTDGELECVTSLENVLKELELDDFIQEEYALIDLRNLANKIDKKTKGLSIK